MSPDQGPPLTHLRSAVGVQDSMEANDAPAKRLLDDYASLLIEVMMNVLSPQDATKAFRESCAHLAEELRDEARHQLHRPARHIHLQALATELEAQAATWLLLSYLHCNDANIAGEGGAPLHGCAIRRTYQQLAAQVLDENVHLQRCGRVVAWLEDLAGIHLDKKTTPVFAQNEGTWTATVLRNRNTEVDPDVTTRGTLQLEEPDQSAEEGLAGRLFKLIRAGRLGEAQQLCRHVGQGWRAASLMGDGDFLPLPLGRAAKECVDDDGRHWDVLRHEVMYGTGSMRTMYKWSAFQAGEQCRENPNRRYEAAIYGSLCGAIGQVLPACEQSWEDTCWALGRCWLELQLDKELRVRPVDKSVMVAGDILAATLHRLGPTYSGKTNVRVLEEGLQVAAGSWPLEPLWETARNVRLADNLGALFSSIEQHSPDLRQVDRTQQHVLQVHLITDRLEPLLEELAAWVLKEKPVQVEDLILQDQQESLFLSVTEAPTAVEETSMLLLLFAAHFCLQLRALELVPDPRMYEDIPDGGYDPLQLGQLQEIINNLLVHFIKYLIHNKMVNLIPAYLCHVRQGSREKMFLRYVQEVCMPLGQPVNDMQCLVAFTRVQEWLQFWYMDRGAPPQHWKHALLGDVREDETRQLLLLLGEKLREAFAGGPQRRVDGACWLLYPFRVEWDKCAEDPDHEMQWQDQFLDALKHINDVCGDLCLGGRHMTEAAHYLLTFVFNTELPEYVEQVVGQQHPDQERATGLAYQYLRLQHYRDYMNLSMEYHHWKDALNHVSTTQQGTVEQRDDIYETGRELMRAIMEHLLHPLGEQFALDMPEDPLEETLRVKAKTITMQVTCHHKMASTYCEGPSADYPLLSPRGAVQLKWELKGVLESVVDAKGVQAVVELVDEKAPAKGLTVTLSMDPEVEEWDRPVMRSWSTMVKIAARLAGNCLPGCPRILVTNVSSSPRTVMELCRQRIVTKLILRCAKIMHHLLCSLGREEVPEGRTLIELVGGARGQHFLEVLSTFTAQKLLQLIEMCLEVDRGLWRDY